MRSLNIEENNAMKIRPNGSVERGRPQAALVMGSLFFLTLLCCFACTPFASKYDAKARLYLEALATNKTNVQFLHSITDLPVPIRESLGADGPVADAGLPFSVGDDNILNLPSRRFLSAMKDGEMYTVAIERGGFSYTWFVVQFVVDKTGKATRGRTQFEPTVQ